MIKIILKDENIVDAYSNGSQFYYNAKEKNIEIWHNFESQILINLDSVTIEVANILLKDYGFEVEVFDENKDYDRF